MQDREQGDAGEFLRVMIRLEDGVGRRWQNDLATQPGHA